MIQTFRRIACVLVIALVCACTSITRVEGEQAIGTRLSVKVPDAWNKVAMPGAQQPYEMWTQEGLRLDQLRFWSGVRAQQPLISLPAGATQPGGKPVRVPTFAAGMQADQLVGLFETAYAADGSLVRITRVEPAPFGGYPGVHFEFSVTRKGDDVQLLGVGWAAVQGGELFALTFTAPRLAFYPRLRPRVDSVAASARIKG